jgi:ATP-dependent Clp protease adapter protein ClpS
VQYVHFSLERVGTRVILSARDEKGTHRLTIDVHIRGMAALGVIARAVAESDEDTEMDLTARGTLSLQGKTE